MDSVINTGLPVMKIICYKKKHFCNTSCIGLGFFLPPWQSSGKFEQLQMYDLNIDTSILNSVNVSI
jgi:hypothetical protein